jgi:hypothetical protein
LKNALLAEWSGKAFQRSANGTAIELVGILVIAIKN